MPPVVAFVVTYATAITVGVTVVSAGISIYNQKKQAKKMEAEFERQQQLQDELNKKMTTQQSEFYGGGGGAALREDTKLMLKTSKAPRNIVFGRDRVSGPMMPFFSYTQNSILYHRFGVVLAGHECDAIETVYFDDEPVTLDTAGWVVAPAKYTDNGRSLFFVEKKLGDAGQTASVFLMEGAALAGTPDAWGADRKAIGVCYVVVHMEANYDVLHDVGLPNVSAIVRGVKAYDPRTATTAWTRNPALLARWWLVDSIYSPLTLDSDIDQAELIASANVCDELVAFSATVTAQRYACDGALSSTANPLENLNKIMAAMDGDAVWVSGKWQLIAGYYKPPTLSIDESHIAGGQINISPYTPTAQIINTISGQYKGPETKYQAAGYPAIAPPAYLAEDGGELYERKDDFDLVNDAMRCQMIAWQRLSRARQQLAVNMICNLKAYNSSPLQTVSLSLAEFGYSNKVFQVRKRVFNGYSVEYFLQETGAAVWNWNYALSNQIVDIPNVNIPVDLTIPSLQNVLVESGKDALVIDADGTVRSRIFLRWDLVSSTFVKNGGQIEWQYRTSDVGSGAGSWVNSVKTAGNATTTYIQPVKDGVAYDLRGRAISQAGRRGEPMMISSHIVIGKIEPPGDVESLSINGAILTWPSVADIDLAGYELRYQANGGFDWDSASPLSQGLVKNTFFDSTSRPSGVYPVLVKAVDTTGNYSLNAASVMTTLPDNVEAFSIDGSILSWAPVGNSNIAGYELRFHYGSNGDWGTATPMTSGLVTGSPFDMVVRPSGIVTLMIKAIDTSGNYSYIPALIVSDLGDAPLANVVETIAFDPIFSGTLTNCTVSGGDLLAVALDSFYDTAEASFYGAETDTFYIASAYGAMVYTTEDFYITNALVGSVATLMIDYVGGAVLIEYRLSNPDALYGAAGDSFYGSPSDEFYPGAGVWMPWPGQITATNDVYQFRVTIGSGAIQGRINAMSLVIDAPDLIESVNDLVVGSGGTAIPYTKAFTAIKNIQATLQANGSGAITVEIDKTSPLTPTAKCFNSSHVAVSGATVDFYLKGY